MKCHKACFSKGSVKISLLELSSNERVFGLRHIEKFREIFEFADSELSHEMNATFAGKSLMICEALFVISNLEKKEPILPLALVKRTINKPDKALTLRDILLLLLQHRDASSPIRILHPYHMHVNLSTADNFLALDLAPPSVAKITFTSQRTKKHGLPSYFSSLPQ